jgi:hypothetical protein
VAHGTFGTHEGRQRGQNNPLPLAILGIFSSACTNSSHSGTPQVTNGPVQTTYAWFRSVNDKDLSATQRHFEPNQRGMMVWGGGDTATWPTFTAIHCSTTDQKSDFAVLYCSFTESPGAAVGNPDSFWSVVLHRQPPGRWLISSYGQG